MAETWSGEFYCVKCKAKREARVRCASTTRAPGWPRPCAPSAAPTSTGSSARPERTPIRPGGAPDLGRVAPPSVSVPLWRAPTGSRAAWHLAAVAQAGTTDTRPSGTAAGPAGLPPRRHPSPGRHRRPAGRASRHRRHPPPVARARARRRPGLADARGGSCARPSWPPSCSSTVTSSGGRGRATGAGPATFAAHGPRAPARLAARAACHVSVRAPEPWRAVAAERLATAGIPLAAEGAGPTVTLVVAGGEPARSASTIGARGPAAPLVILLPDRARLGPFVVPAAPRACAASTPTLVSTTHAVGWCWSSSRTEAAPPLPGDPVLAHAAVALGSARADDVRRG